MSQPSKPAARPPEALPTPKDPTRDSSLPGDGNALVRAFHRFLAAAHAVPDEQVRVMRADPQLVYQNVVLGVKAVLPYEMVLARDLPTVNWDLLRELPELGLAVSFAAAQSGRRRGGTLTPLLRKAGRLRRLLLSAAEMLVLAGEILARDVDKIRRGSGPIDLANDCLDLVALFHRHQTARQRTVVTEALLAETEAAGQQLLGRLTRSTEYAKALGMKPVEPTTSLRDRMWTLLTQQHRELRRVGMWLFMERVDEHVPALLARGRRKDPASAVTPAQTPATEDAPPSPETAPPAASKKSPAPPKR